MCSHDKHTKMQLDARQLRAHMQSCVPLYVRVVVRRAEGMYCRICIAVLVQGTDTIAIMQQWR